MWSQGRIVLAVIVYVLLASTTTECFGEGQNIERQNAESGSAVDVDQQHTSSSLTSSADYDYLIVGGGASGIQMALFLEQSNHSYVVLEKNEMAGSFWLNFPRFGELISINKWVQDETQKLKYDWHSMLHAPLRMENVTDEYFPKGRDWQRYMQSVVEQSRINIEYGVEVESITSALSSYRDTPVAERKQKKLPCLKIRNEESLRCARRRVFVGTGLREKKEPLLRALGGIPYSQMTKSMAYRRRVCILGNGNSAFEVAQNVMSVAESVSLLGKHPLRLSAVTRYTGDVRVKFLQVLENLNGKLLDVVEDFEYRHEKQKKRLPKQFPHFNEHQLDTFSVLYHIISWIWRSRCQTLVIATGFESHVPGMELQNTRFPPTKDWYESTDVPNVHFLGWLMHQGDFRMGAGGFFSGFRYLIRNLAHHVNHVDFGVPYPYDILTKEQVVERVLARYHAAHDLVILQDGVVIKDVAIKVTAPDGHDGNGTTHYKYFEGISYKFQDELENREDVISFYLGWGNGRTVGHVFDNNWRYTDTGGINNMFLHPIIQVGDKRRHVIGSLDMTYTGPLQVPSITKAVREALDGDLRLFSPDESVPYERTVINQGESQHTSFETVFVDDEYQRRMNDLSWKASLEAVARGNLSILTSTIRSIEPALLDFGDSLIGNHSATT